MRNASGALIALLNSASQVLAADLLTVQLQDGTIIRLTDAQVAIRAVTQWDGAAHTFVAGLPFTRAKTKIMVGLEVDTTHITLNPDPATDTLGGVPWQQAARAGALDEATIMLERCFMATAGDVSAGTLIQFAGRVGQVIPSRTIVEIEVRSGLELFAAQMPRNVYQPGCLHTLYDSGCALLKSTFTLTGTAQSGSTTLSIVTGLSKPDDYYALGTIKFTSGANVNRTRTVRSYLSNVAVPIVAFPYPVTIGDAFSIAAGCDKQQATCSAKFANLAHFRGMPYVPDPEAAI